MNVSITQAHKMTGVARSTIYKDMDEGRLSYTENGRGKKEIMVSELQRVYGNIDQTALTKKNTNRQQNNTSKNVSDVANSSNRTNQDETDQVAVLQERILSLKNTIEEKEAFIDDLKSERQKTREAFEEQVEGLKQSLDKAQEGYNQITKLLENKTTENGAEWEKTAKALENRISNQEKNEKERKEREEKLIEENKKIKHALSKKQKELAEEQNKGFFKKLFG